MTNVLITGAGAIYDDKIVAEFEAAGFSLRMESWNSEVPALVEAESFDAIVVRLPLPGVGLGVLLSSIRSKDALCRRAGLVVLTPKEDRCAVERLIGRGVNRVLLDSATPQGILETLQEVLGAAKRISLRLPVQLEVTLPAGESMAFCQTENLSESGMLLRGIQRYPLGTRFSFELQIPGTDRCLEGVAEVTRTTDSGRERVEGLGARFVELKTSDRWMLDKIFADPEEPSN